MKPEQTSLILKDIFNKKQNYRTYMQNNGYLLFSQLNICDDVRVLCIFCCKIYTYTSKDDVSVINATVMCNTCGMSTIIPVITGTSINTKTNLGLRLFMDECHDDYFISYYDNK